MKTNLELYNRVRQVPEEAQKIIKGGRINGMTDINPMWRIKVLTEEFGQCGIGWYFDVIKQWIEDGSDGQKSAFVNINLFVKKDGEWSKGIFGNGGSAFIVNESKGAYTSDECYKMALTDAIGSACKLLGIGADIFYAKDRTKYDNELKEAVLMAKFDEIMQNVSKCTTTDELTQLWTSNVPLHANKEFKDAVAEKGNQLKAKK